MFFIFVTVCAVLYKGISIILDMTWTGWDKLRNIADERGIIYKRGDCSISPYVQAIDDLLIMKNATDVGLIFEDERGAQILIVHYCSLLILYNEYFA